MTQAPPCPLRPRLAGRVVSVIGLLLLFTVLMPFLDSWFDPHPRLWPFLLGWAPPPLNVLEWYGPIPSLLAVLFLAVAAVALGPGVSRGNASSCRYARDVGLALAALMAAGAIVGTIYRYHLHQLWAPSYAARGLPYSYDLDALWLFIPTFIAVGAGSLALPRLVPAAGAPSPPRGAGQPPAA
jgi:hypothetical protein